MCLTLFDCVSTFKDFPVCFTVLPFPLGAVVIDMDSKLQEIVICFNNFQYILEEAIDAVRLQDWLVLARLAIAFRMAAARCVRCLDHRGRSCVVLLHKLLVHLGDIWRLAGSELHERKAGDFEDVGQHLNKFGIHGMPEIHGNLL